MFIRSALEQFLPGLFKLDIGGPAIVGLSLLRTTGYEFGGGLRYEGPSPPADRPDLVLPEVWIDRIDQTPSVNQLSQQILDILWQCFGHERCPYFDALGAFIKNA
jgi:hypothetical protein